MSQQETGPPVLIADPRSLERACERWQHLDVLGVDTEFVRERTFYPGLGLIQISDGEDNVLVDPVAIRDLAPLQSLLTDPRITKVLHSCSEDMEVFFHRFGELPRRLFDTQIAAAFAGHGYSLGYSGLVEALFGVEIPKHQTRTDWLRRPLAAAQQKYAALDVAYLVPSYQRLSEDLRRLGREAWAEEEFEQLLDADRFRHDPERDYLKVRRALSLDRRQLAVLRALVNWREDEARRRDLPRNFVVPEAALAELARRQPRSREALEAARELRRQDVRRHGRALLGVIDNALRLPDEELPPRPPRPLSLAPYKSQIEKMRRLVAETAARLDLPAELLATRSTVERLVRRVAAGREPPLPRELRGWRREVVGERLLKLVSPL